MSLTESSSAVIPFPTVGQIVFTSTPTRDREAARRFLRLLDPAARAFTFQTFHDRQKGLEIDSKLARSTSNRVEVL
jgi:hypothetical protein